MTSLGSFVGILTKSDFLKNVKVRLLIHMGLTCLMILFQLQGILDLNLGGRRYTWMKADLSKASKLDRFLVSAVLPYQYYPGLSPYCLVKF